MADDVTIGIDADDKASAKIANVGKKLADVGKKITELQAQQYKGYEKMIGVARPLEKALNKVFSVGIEKSNRFGLSLGTVIGGLAKGTKAAAVGVAGLATGAVGLAVGAIMAHDELASMRARLDALAGGAEAGGKAKEAIDDIAAQANVTDDQLQPLAESLLAIGTPVDQLRVKLKALAAQQALGLGGAESVIESLVRLGEGVKFGSKQLLGLTKTAGITGEALAGKLGISLKDFRAKMKDGTLDSKKMADAIVAVATEKGIPALNAQAKSGKQAILNLADAFTDMVGESVKTEDAVGALATLKASFDGNTESGKQMRASIGSAFEAMSTAAVKAAPIAIAAVESVSNAVSGLIDFVNDPSLSSFAMIGEKKKKAVDVVETSDVRGTAEKQLAELEARYDALKVKAKESMGLLGGGPSEEMITQAALLEGEIAQAKKAVSDAAAKGGEGSQGAGAAVAAGYAAGIRGGITDPVGAAMEMAMATQAALAKADQSKSPSRKYEQFGEWGGEGYAMGFDKSRPVIANAMAGAFDPAAVMGNLKGGAAKSFNASSNATISISGAADPQATAAAVREVLVGELAGAFEQLSIEVSGG